MNDGPDLPVLRLEHDSWRAEVYDPRPDPLALGARYVHGGYVAAWWRGERLLTARPREPWDPYVGQGLPEVFEWPLGREAAAEGDEFLRIGAGRLRRQGSGWPQSGGRPSTPVAWELLDQRADRLVMRCRDRMAIAGAEYGYDLERTIAISSKGLASTTRLAITCPWSTPVIHFAHPFLAQTSGDGTALCVPPGAECGALAVRDGRLRCGSAGGFGALVGVWGWRGDLVLELDRGLGGGELHLTLDRPLDKLVVYATPCAFSVEPYLARAWHDRETAAWTLRYRFDP